ncbi:hypothetical protein E5K00_05465 [Hymenobacter aquaticus]|uniref:Uncharacterized protein n=1 Tax=Hymenobacter aquaticus TaxID=1867101 RepID=A0A4Z0Q6I4_9BACT|nr:hypothetical protein [Hymenobacter aquaticus]TGE24661.1 hypothetical protein E5K00_05465 [Hymenobacter aquaticus]
MALDPSILTNPAECDEVLDDLTAELASYQNRDTNQDYADTRSEQVKAKIKALLTGVEAEITAFTTILATVGLPDDVRKYNESKLRKANFRRANLLEQGSARSNAARFLAAVDAEQIDAQVAVLTNAITKVTERRAQLSA